MEGDGIHFCKECYNLTYLHLDEDEKLIHACKICEKTEPFTGTNFCIYSVDYVNLDKGEIINTNKYITHDKTLPSIKDNPNIRCPNKDCNSPSFKYIKYDSGDMKYIYICEGCGQKWSN